MIDITHPAVHGSLAALVAHPGYYYLYALYADYPINNAWFREREYAEVLRERLRTLQPLLALVQPYRKSPALRLFTERESLARFPPEKVDEAWRQLRRLIERVGPPAGWPDRPAPAPPPYRAHPPPHPPREQAPASPQARGARPGPAAGAAPDLPARPAPAKGRRPARKSRPRSPVDYSREV